VSSIRLHKEKLEELYRRDVCSLCGTPFKHNKLIVPGLDAHGNVAMAGECCVLRLDDPFAFALYVDRVYDFLTSYLLRPSTPRKTNAPCANIAKIDGPLAGIELSKLPAEPTIKQAINKLWVCKRAVATIDGRLARVERRTGTARAIRVELLDSLQKNDDRDWFRQNPGRSHRARLPLPSEIDEEHYNPPPGRNLIILVRQAEPGIRLVSTICVDTESLPLPDSETLAHTLFNVRQGPGPFSGTLSYAAMAEKDAALKASQ
jgi:hypothetical protein